MNIDYKTLLDLLDKVPQGEWEFERDGNIACVKVKDTEIDVVDDGSAGGEYADTASEATLKYIAALSPDVVRALLRVYVTRVGFGETGILQLAVGGKTITIEKCSRKSYDMVVDSIGLETPKLVRLNWVVVEKGKKYQLEFCCASSAIQGVSFTSEARDDS